MDEEKRTLDPNSLAIGCLKVGLKEALFESRLTGKPILTETNLNRFSIKSETDIVKYQELVKGAQMNLKGFLSKHFVLTPEHEKAIESISERDSNDLKEVLKEVSDKKLSMNFDFFPLNSSPCGYSKVSGKFCFNVGWAKVCISVEPISEIPVT
jgi:hypothetical protein